MTCVHRTICTYDKVSDYGAISLCLQFWCYLFFMHWLVGEGSKTSFKVYIALKCFVDRTTFNLSFPFILCILQRHTKVFCTVHHIQSFLFYAALAASRTGKQPAPRQKLNLFHINHNVSPSLGKPLFEKCPAHPLKKQTMSKYTRHFSYKGFPRRAQEMQTCFEHLGTE